MRAMNVLISLTRLLTLYVPDTPCIRMGLGIILSYHFFRVGSVSMGVNEVVADCGKLGKGDTTFPCLTFSIFKGFWRLELLCGRPQASGGSYRAMPCYTRVKAAICYGI